MINYILEKLPRIPSFDLIAWVHEWTGNKLYERRLGNNHAMTDCTWCRQNMDDGIGVESEEFEHDESLEVRECGVCGGTSLWVWGFGFQYVTHLDPPEPQFETMPGYDHLRDKYHGTYQVQERTSDTLDQVEAPSGSSPSATVGSDGNVHRVDSAPLGQEASSGADETDPSASSDGNR